MKLLRSLMVAFLVLNVSLFVPGCGGYDVDNPREYVDTDDDLSPEEREMREEEEAELEALISEEDANL